MRAPGPEQGACPGLSAPSRRGLKSGQRREVRCLRDSGAWVLLLCSGARWLGRGFPGREGPAIAELACCVDTTSGRRGPGTQHTFYILVSDGRRPASFLYSFSFTITWLSFYSLAPDFSWHLGTGLRSPSVWGPERRGGPCERQHQSLVFWGWEPPAGLGDTGPTCEEGAFLQIGLGGRSGAGGRGCNYPRRP